MMTVSADEIEFDSISAAEDANDSPVTNLDSLPVRAVPLNTLGPGFFQRQSGTDASHVQLLADAANSDELPAILIQKSSLRIVDGMHRIEAAKLRGLQSINARFVDCTDEEAFILAVKSNTLHGLPLSRADRISGAKRILVWHHDWSNRAVAALTGLSAKTIAALRCPSTDDEKDDGKRLGRDGKRRPVTGAEGRRRATEYLAAHPDASVREAARETDVSVGTVHDIRARLRRGEDPEAVGRRGTSEEPTGSTSDAAGHGARPANGANGTLLHLNGANGTVLHLNGANGMNGTALHANGASSANGTALHANGTSSPNGTALHPNGANGTALHANGTSSANGTALHVNGASSANGTALHVNGASSVNRTSSANGMSSANGTDPGSKRRNGPAPTWPSIASKLANDPAVKYTESGRAFLRWMATRAIDPSEWDKFIDAVPVHWAEGLSLVAQGVSDAWREFADQLREK